MRENKQRGKSCSTHMKWWFCLQTENGFLPHSCAQFEAYALRSDSCFLKVLIVSKIWQDRRKKPKRKECAFPLYILILSHESSKRVKSAVALWSGACSNKQKNGHVRVVLLRLLLGHVHVLACACAYARACACVCGACARGCACVCLLKYVCVCKRVPCAVVCLSPCMGVIEEIIFTPTTKQNTT